MRVKQIRTAAEGYFGMAWNLLSVGNAIESGDNTRSVSSSDPTVIVPGWRNMIHPHDQAENKWIRKIPEKVGTEEDLFGIMGRWFQERIRHDPEFKRGFEEYHPGYRFFQRVTTGSLFDHSYFVDNRTNLAQVFSDPRNIDKVSGYNLYKFNMPNGLTFDQLRDADIGNVYTDVLDSVIKIQTLLTIPEIPKDPREAFSLFIGALLSIQSRAFKIDDNTKGLTVIDELLWRAYKPDPNVLEDLVVASIGSVGGGFTEYTSEKIIALPPRLYDSVVFGILSDDRIYRALGLRLGSKEVQIMRQHFMKVFHAHMPGDRSQTLEMAGRGERSDILRNIKHEVEKWVGKK
jgi:hypothetical protein